MGVQRCGLISYGMNQVWEDLRVLSCASHPVSLRSSYSVHLYSFNRKILHVMLLKRSHALDLPSFSLCEDGGVDLFPSMLLPWSVRACTCTHVLALLRGGREAGRSDSPKYGFCHYRVISVLIHCLSVSISRSNLPTGFVQAMVVFYSEHSKLFRGVKLFLCHWYKALLYIWLWQHFKGNCSPLFIVWVISNKYVGAGECGSKESPANTYRNSLDAFLLLFSRFSSSLATCVSQRPGKCGLK